ncbi:hypothetical protein [Neolewinella antarctica]|uniref:Tetratricopeptide repeat protein n=1 Tax=Neolewinella antarctica TaxID=442734 RepID=A0ABX0X7L7_9BACT|nr:hypothetical protein [Neolewinella antarctica]NJC25227.1 hypothetical protein [Neolewinella antarctica]
MRLLLLTVFFLTSVTLSADDLYERLRLLLPGDEPATVTKRQFLYQSVTTLFREMETEEKVHRKRKKKRIKRIRKYLAENVFRVQSASASLDDVLRTHHYSGAAAAALTVLCLEKYDIEYAIYVDHWKAYVVADPGGRDEAFYFGEDDEVGEARAVAFRADYLAAVRATILPDLPPLSGNNAKIAFSTNYYQPGKSLTFEQLAAYNQYVAAQSAYRNGFYPAAILLAENALQYEDRAAFLVILQAAQTQLAARVKPQVAGDLATLFDGWNSEPDNEYLPAAILHHFDEQQRLILTGDTPGMTDFLLQSYLDKAPAGQEKWRTEMTQLQELRLLSHFFKTGNRPAARQLATRLYEQHPDDAKVKYLLGEIIVDQLRGGGTDGPDFQQRMQAAASDYPFLKDHPRFIDLYLREQAIKVRDLYAANRVDRAEIALDRFRESLIDLSIGEDRNLWTLTAFTSASYYHFLVADYQRAVDYINEGIKYAPDDQYLLHRLSVLEKYL